MKDLEKFKNLGELLSKTQMKKILGGRIGTDCTAGCCNCHGGISCGPACPGQYGQTECYNTGYPSYGCTYGGSPCTGTAC